MDDPLIILTILSRWIHILTAIVVLGGSVFMRFVLMPAAETISDEEHAKLRESIMRRWKMVVHIGITLFFISGLYNYLFVTRHQHQGDSLYHMLVGIKILLALAVFFLASVLVGRAKMFEKLRQKRKMWLMIVILIAVIVVAISGFVKVRPAPADDKSAQTTEIFWNNVDSQPQIATFPSSKNDSLQRNFRHEKDQKHGKWI